MPAAGFEHLSMEVFKLIVGDLDLIQRLKLRKVSKPLRRGVDTQKVDFSVIYLQTTDESALLGIDEHQIKYTITKHGECQIETPDVIKWFPKENPSKLAANDAVSVLGLARRVEKLQIVAHRFTDDVVNAMPEGLQALEITINVSRIKEFLALLNKIDSHCLQTVTVTCEYGRRFQQIFATQHFKKASAWHMFGLPAIEADDLQKFGHFQEFSVKLANITGQVCLQIKEMMMSVDTLKKCRIQSVEVINVEEVARTLGEPVANDFVVHEVYLPEVECLLMINISDSLIEAIKI